jgi:hypothetical protein
MCVGGFGSGGLYVLLRVPRPLCGLLLDLRKTHSPPDPAVLALLTEIPGCSRLLPICSNRNTIGLRWSSAVLWQISRSTTCQSNMCHPGFARYNLSNRRGVCVLRRSRRSPQSGRGTRSKTCTPRLMRAMNNAQRTECNERTHKRACKRSVSNRRTLQNRTATIPT